MAPTAEDSYKTTDSTSSSLLEKSLREANKQFFIRHQGFTREQLFGHRMRAAFAAVKAFVSDQQEHRTADFEDRLFTYTRLLMQEMVRDLALVRRPELISR